jgi:hypothetical protein
LSDGSLSDCPISNLDRQKPSISALISGGKLGMCEAGSCL